MTFPEPEIMGRVQTGREKDENSFQVKKIGEQCCAIVNQHIALENKGQTSPCGREALSGHAPGSKRGKAGWVKPMGGTEGRLGCFSFYQEATGCG